MSMAVTKHNKIEKNKAAEQAMKTILRINMHFYYFET